MAKVIRPIVGAAAKTGKKIYATISGVHRKVKKIYTVVNGQNKLAWGGGSFGFIAGGNTRLDYNASGRARFLSSTNGTSWVVRDLGKYTDQYFTVYASAYGNGITVIVGQYTYYTTDGVTFTEITSLANAQLRSICYGNGRFVAVSYTDTYYSLDGINWTKSTYSISSRPVDVCYDYVLNRFVCICLQPPGTTDSSGAYFIVSTDGGVTWLSGSHYSSYIPSPSKLVFDGTYFYATGSGRLARFTMDANRRLVNLTIIGSGAFVWHTQGETFVTGYTSGSTLCKRILADGTLEDFGTGLTISGETRQIIKADGAYYIIEYGTNGSIFRRPVGSSSWTKIYTFPGNDNNYFQMTTICYCGEE